MMRTYNSVQEMFEAMRRDRERADAEIEDWQRELKPGDKLVFLAQMSNGVLIAYAEVRDPVEDDRPYYDLNNAEDRIEFEAVKAHYGPQWSSSYRATRSFSPFVPEGELGDVHLSRFVAKLTDEAFEAARRAGWPQLGSWAEV